MTARALTAKGRATRERIIHTAMDLFAAESYAAVSIREIAARSGVSSGAIYATFRGKAEVLAETVSASLAADLEMMEPELQGRSLPEIVGRQFARMNEPGRKRLRLLLMNAAAAARADTDVREILGPVLQTRMNEWTAAYEDWQSTNGAEGAFDMRALVGLLISADLGLAVLDELGSAPSNPRHAAAIVEHMLGSLTEASG